MPIVIQGELDPIITSVMLCRCTSRLLKKKGKTWQQLAWGLRAKGSHLMCRITSEAVIERMKKLLD